MMTRISYHCGHTYGWLIESGERTDLLQVRVRALVSVGVSASPPNSLPMTRHLHRHSGEQRRGDDEATMPSVLGSYH